MRTTRKAFPLKDLIAMTSSGTVDLAASKSALKSLAADAAFDWLDADLPEDPKQADTMLNR